MHENKQFYHGTAVFLPSATKKSVWGWNWLAFWANFLHCAWRAFSPLSSVCDWISVSSIFCSLFAVLACACREHRTTCFKAGNDCVRHSIEDYRFTVLIPILKTCYLPRIVRGLFACLFYSPGEEVTFYRNQTWMSKTHSTDLLNVCMP